MKTLCVVALLFAGCRHTKDLELTPEAADAYVDFIAFVAAKIQNVDVELSPELHQRGVEALRADWAGANPDWQKLVLRSPELYVLTLQAWRAADAGTREQMRASWAKQLKLPLTHPQVVPTYKSKQPTALELQAQLDIQKMHFQMMSNVSRAYHEMSMTAIHNINSDSRWHYEYRRKY